MNLKKHIGLKVKQARQRKSWTQEQLAGRIHKAVETISHIERGATFTGLETLEQIASVLGQPMAYFFEGVEKTKGHSVSQVETQEKAKLLIESLSRNQLLPIIAMLEATVEQDKKRNS